MDKEIINIDIMQNTTINATFPFVKNLVFSVPLWFIKTCLSKESGGIELTTMRTKASQRMNKEIISCHTYFIQNPYFTQSSS